MEHDPDFVFNLAKQQTKEFIEKVQDRNKKEARLIVAKYDIRYPFSKPVRDHPYNYSFLDLQKAMLENLKERQKFLDLIAEYL